MIPHPLWFVAKSADQPTGWRGFVALAYTPDDSLDLTNDFLLSLQQNTGFLRKEPEDSSTTSLISDCLRLYAQAMDAPLYYQCLVGLWQLAEALARGTSVGGDTGKVAKRLAWHGSSLGLKGSGYEASLVQIGKKRNAVVHKGILSVHKEELNILKLACETALLWIIAVRKSLPTKVCLDEFYALRDVGAARLSDRRASAAYIERLRRKSLGS